MLEKYKYCMAELTYMFIIVWTIQFKSLI